MPHNIDGHFLMLEPWTNLMLVCIKIMLKHLKISWTHACIHWALFPYVSLQKVPHYFWCCSTGPFYTLDPFLAHTLTGGERLMGNGY